MMYDYQSITPGPKVFTGKQFLNELEDYFIDPGKDSALRSKIKTVFHKYDDGLSSERIYDFITKL
jgi:CDP-glycerol glycerophosphotransferase (TagB/SpsB family)